jgi:putative Mg2+ transporter-C (MgtC) family protein
MVDLSSIDILARLSLTTVLAALIGAEREWREKPAGIRTNAMVGLGACLLGMASIQVPGLWPDNRPIDPGRIAAQVVSGIGFLGAGVIVLRSGRGAVFGLTTAATLWVVAGLGLVIGMGYFFEAIAATLMVFFTFFVLGKVVKVVRIKRGDRRYTREPDDHDDRPEIYGHDPLDDE